MVPETPFHRGQHRLESILPAALLVQEDRRQDRLQRIGEGLFPADGRQLSQRDGRVRQLQAQIPGPVDQRLPADHGGAQLGEIAFRPIRLLPEQQDCHRGVQQCVAEELQALVVLAAA
jgi:hypothetical protein